MDITQKIISTKNEDMKLALTELESAIKSVEVAKKQLETSEILSKRQAEEIGYLTKRNEVLKRTRMFDISASCLGLVMGVTGSFLNKSEGTKDIGNALFYTGVGLCSAGTVSLIFTIPL